MRLLGNYTLLQEAWRRARSVAPASRGLVVAGKAHQDLIRSSLPDLPKGNLLIEPEGRDTAGAVAYAAGRILRLDPQAVMLVLPGDHVISPVPRFACCALAAAVVAQREAALVTFGIVPRAPATAYGYIHRGEPLAPATPEPGEPRTFRVLAFKEKPDYATAESYVAGGAHYWNGGIFAFPMAQLMEEFDTHLPRHASMARALATAKSHGAWQRTAKLHFAGLPRVSVDFGIMEKARRVAAIAADFNWDDIGSWTAVGDHLPMSDHNAVAPGTQLEAVESSGNVVMAPGRRVALVGVQGLAVVDDPAGLLICSLKKDQLVKQVAQRMPPFKPPVQRRGKAVRVQIKMRSPGRNGKRTRGS